MLSKIIHKLIIKMLRLKAVSNPLQYIELVSNAYIILHSYPVNGFSHRFWSASC
jgi:hypothetical protein